MQDCNDGDPDVFPYATETPSDTIDSNCDGKDDPNVIPVATQCDINPASPTSVQDLTVDEAGNDADDGPLSVTFQYRWYVDNVQVTDETTDSLGEENYQKWQLIEVDCDPHDGWESGIPMTSAPALVSNVGPSAPTMALPVNKSNADQIVSTVTYPALDPDPTDVVTYAYTWLVDNVVESGQNDKYFPAGIATRGEVVKVQVQATDGLDFSAVAEATTTIVNAPPSEAVASTSPGAAGDGEDIVCSVAIAATDADGDTPAYSFAWLKNGGAYGGPTTTTTLAGDTIPNAQTTVSDVFVCTITADDGNSGTSVSQPATTTVDARNWLETDPTVSVTGNINDGDTGEPVPGVLVSVRGAVPTITAVTDSNGDYAVEVPFAQFALHTTSTEHYGALSYFAGTLGQPLDLTDMLYMMTNDTISDVADATGRTFDNNKGAVTVMFMGPSWFGGESAVVTPNGDGDPIAYGEAMLPFVNTETAPEGTPVLVYTNIPAGAAQVDSINTPAHTACTPTYPLGVPFEVLPQTTTAIAFTCNWTAGEPDDSPPWSEGPGGSDITWAGQIRDFVTGYPVVGVTVENLTGGGSTTTNADGEYQLAGLAPNDLIKVSKTGYWGEIFPVAYDEEFGLWEEDFEVVTDSTFPTYWELMKLPSIPDPTKGLINVNTVANDGYNNPLNMVAKLGGEIVSFTGSPYGYVRSFDGNGDPVNSSAIQDPPGYMGINPHQEPEEDEEPEEPEGEVMFFDVDPTSSGLSFDVNGNSVGNTCFIESKPAEWIVEAKTITAVDAECTPTPPPTVLSGTVSDNATGAPMAGVTVTINGGQYTVTAGDGSFNMIVPPVPTEIRVASAGYWTALEYMFPFPGDNPNLIFNLVSDGEMASRATALGISIPETQGAAMFGFNGTLSPSGGETVAVSNYPSSYHIDGAGWVPSTALSATSEPELHIFDITPSVYQESYDVDGVLGFNHCPSGMWPGKMLLIEPHTITLTFSSCFSGPPAGDQQVRLDMQFTADANPGENNYALSCTGTQLPDVSFTKDFGQGPFESSNDQAYVTNGQTCSLTVTDSGADGGPFVDIQACGQTLDAFTVTGASTVSNFTVPACEIDDDEVLYNCDSQPNQFTYANFYVSSTYGSDWNSGGMFDAFNTIQHALNQAQPGDFVMVFPGVYPEFLQVPDGVLLSSSDGPSSAFKTEITEEHAVCAWCAPGIIPDTMIEFTAGTGATVSGFHIDGGSNAVATVRNGSFNTRLTNNVIDAGFSTYGVLIEPNSSAEVIDNTIVEAGAANIHAVDNSTYVLVANNIIANAGTVNLSDANGFWDVDHNILYTSDATPQSISGVNGLENLMDADPQFTDVGQRQWSVDGLTSPSLHEGTGRWGSQGDCTQPDIGADFRRRERPNIAGLEITGTWRRPGGGNGQIDFNGGDVNDFNGDQYYVMQYDNWDNYLVAQNSNWHTTNPDDWSRMDWAWHDGTMFFCHTTIDQVDQNAAQATSRPADTDPATTGCNGGPWKELWYGIDPGNPRMSTIGQLQRNVISASTDVIVDGVISAVSDDGFQLTRSVGPNSEVWNGIWVKWGNIGASGYSVGDQVTVTGRYRENDNSGAWSNSRSDIAVDGFGWASVNVLGPPAFVPGPTPVDLLDVGEAWEGLIITIPNVTITSIEAGWWEIGNGIGLNNKFFASTNQGTFSVGDTFTSVTGVLRWGGSTGPGLYRIEPLQEADLQGYVDN